MDLGLSARTIEKYGNPDEWCYSKHPQTGEMTHQRSVWGFGGWFSHQIDRALRDDDPNGFVDLMKAAKLDANSQTFDGRTMAQYCDKYGSERCRAVLGTIPVVVKESVAV